MLHSRLERVQSLIQAEVAQIIDRELTNPNLPRFITVYGVKVSKDLSRALVTITFLQDQSEEVIKRTVKELNHSAGFIGRLLAQRVTIKRHPQLKFVYTDSTRFALDIEKVFQQLKQEEGYPAPEDDEEEGEGETEGEEEDEDEGGEKAKD